MSLNGEASLVDSDEAALIARLRARDLEALGELYRRLGGAMGTLARSLLRNVDEADDVVEESLMRIHDKAPGFRGERGLRTWALRIVANRCRDRLRRRRFSAGAPEELDPLSSAGLRVDPAAEWDEELDRTRLLARLERAIAELPLAQREAVLLRDRLGLSYEEAAKTIGISVHALKSKLFRARETLKKKLAGALDE